VSVCLFARRNAITYSLTYLVTYFRGRPKVKISLLAKTESRTKSSVFGRNRMFTESKVVVVLSAKNETETENGSYPNRKQYNAEKKLIST